MANEQAPDDWATELVRRVGQEVKRARDGKSAAWLSDRTAELGYRISPAVIAKLDSGHRGAVLGVAELLILAAALNISPMALLYPDMPSGLVEMLPHQVAKSMDAYLWTTGIGKSPSRAPGARRVWSALDRHKLVGEHAKLRSRLGLGVDLEGETLSPGTRDAMAWRVKKIGAEISKLNAEIRDAGGSVSDPDTTATLGEGDEITVLEAMSLETPAESSKDA